MHDNGNVYWTDLEFGGTFGNFGNIFGHGYSSTQTNYKLETNCSLKHCQLQNQIRSKQLNSASKGHER